MLVYVAGPYRAKGDRTVADNIAQARKVAIALWEAGHVAVCPHLNTAHFEDDCKVPDERYLAGDLHILARCDAIVLTPDWQMSEGAKDEYYFAQHRGIPVYFYPELPAVHPTELRCLQQTKAFIDTVMTMYRLHLDKNTDYSPANILGAGELGCMVRLWDKIARLMNLLGFRLKAECEGFEAPKEPKFEAIDDTYLDAANYAVIARLVRQGVWGK